MDLRNFIAANEETHTLDYIAKGFQRSEFYDNFNDIAILIKQVVISLSTEADKQRILDQLQSGGISSRTISEKCAQSKKISFCTDFNTLISNIQALIGFEFSKYLYVIFGIKHFVKCLIEQIPESQKYEEIYELISKILNLLSIGSNQTDKTDAITLDSSFKLENLITHDREAIDYFIADVNVLNIDNILQTILKNIGVCIKLENVIMFENDKKKYYSILMNMYNHLKLNIYQMKMKVNEY